MYQEHVKVDLRTAKIWLQCMDYIEATKAFIMLRETGNVRWAYECRHRIIESFRSDMSYSLCQVCSTLYPGNAQASFNSSLAAPDVCWRVSHCAKDWETMGEIVDRHSDWASSDKVSEKPWWSYKRQRHDWKCAATVVVQHASLCCNSWCHDITSGKASHYHLFSMWSSERQGICITCETWTNVSIGLVHMIHLMAMYRSFVLYPAGWQQNVSIGLVHMIHLMAMYRSFVLYPAGWQQVWWNGESCQWDRGTFWQCICQKCNH